MGSLLFGCHALKIWSSTQFVIALSSGEADNYGPVQRASTGIGLQSTWCDFGIKISLVFHTDASAAKGIGNRRGLGKVRNTELCQLWPQDLVARDQATLRKVEGAHRFSDSQTKHTSAERIAQHMVVIGHAFWEGRYPEMPQK